jgi:ankyrin repeat protein
VNTQDHAGRTALHWAIDYRESGFVSIFRELVNRGADLHIKTYDERLDVVEYLESRSWPSRHRKLKIFLTPMLRITRDEGLDMYSIAK